MGPEETNFLFREPRFSDLRARIDYELSLSLSLLRENLFVVQKSQSFDAFFATAIVYVGNTKFATREGGYVFLSAPVESGDVRGIRLQIA